MLITCNSYTPRAVDGLSGRADLVLGLEGGGALEVKGWSVYVGGNERYLNPPSVRSAGSFANIMKIVGYEERERFRVAALTAIDAFRAGTEVGRAA